MYTLTGELYSKTILSENFPVTHSCPMCEWAFAFILFPFWVRSLILNRALSAWPKSIHTWSCSMHIILPKYRGNMSGVTAVLSTCQSNPASFLLLIFPLGFPLLQSAATRPAMQIVKSKLSLEVCTLPRKPEARQPDLHHGAGLVK